MNIFQFLIIIDMINIIFYANRDRLYRVSNRGLLDEIEM